ncbi:PREDICTED: peroxidase 47-like [Ipomoea nil]|uniref:peroxidase 47-like n=1 Tax=Ipomoea nil TaxID=35883 RepID=UPI000900D97C|nr:PREDICTED: peroxidase 47-like [Ipomoea nil]
MEYYTFSLSRHFLLADVAGLEQSTCSSCCSSWSNSPEPQFLPKTVSSRGRNCSEHDMGTHLQQTRTGTQGCDGSILLDSTPRNKAEKDSISNQSLAGYDMIDEIKVRLEEECPRVVSFQNADVAGSSGQKGRQHLRDIEALSDLPSSFSNISTLLGDFASREWDVHDLVVLAG